MKGMTHKFFKITLLITVLTVTLISVVNAQINHPSDSNPDIDYVLPVEDESIVESGILPGTPAVLSKFFRVGFTFLLSIGLSIVVIILLKRSADLTARYDTESVSAAENEALSRQLNQQKNSLENILGAIPSGLIVFNSDFTVRTVNESFLHQFSVDPNKLLGVHYMKALGNRTDSTAGDEKSELIAALDEFRSTRKPMTNQVTTITCFGDGLRSIRYSIIGFSEKRLRETLLVIDDITDYVQTARLRQFSAIVSGGATEIKDFTKFYELIHTELKKILPAENICIALRDPDNDSISIPYSVNQHDNGAKGELFNTLASYLLKKGEPVFLTKADLISLSEGEEFQSSGVTPELYLAGMLTGNDGAYGLISLQDYSQNRLYREDDCETLQSVANEISLAIDNKHIKDSIARAKIEWEQSVDVIPDMIALIDNDKRIMRVNRSMADKLSVTPQQAVGIACSSSKKSKTTPLPFCDHLKLLSESGKNSLEITEQRWKGEFNVAVSPLKDKEGASIGTVYHARNITERKLAEKALRESEKRLEVIFSRSLDIIMVVDPESGKIIGVNPMVKTLLGYEPKNLNGKEVTSIFPSETLESRDELIDNISVHGAVFDSQQFTHADGSVVEMDLTASLIPWGTGKAILVTFRDVTERKKTEAALRESLQSSADIVQSIPSGLFIFQFEEPDKLMLSEGNKQAEQLTHLVMDESRGKAFEEIWPIYDRKTLKEKFSKVMESGATFVSEELFYKKDKTERYFIVRAFRMPNKRLGVAIENVTESQRTREQLHDSLDELHRLASFPDLNPNPVVEFSIVGEHPEALTYFNEAASKEFPDLELRGINHPVFQEIEIPIQALQRKTDENVIQIIRADDKRYELHISYVVSSKVVRIYIIDVTERELAEEQVRVSEKFNRDLVTEAPVGIAYVGKEGKIMFVNPVMNTMMMDEEKDQIIGMSALELLDDETEDVASHLDKLMNGKAIHVEEIKPQRFNANRSFDIHGTPRYDASGAVIGAMLMVADVTENKKLQAQLRHASKMEAVGTLAGGIAHDFNNLLTVILGNTQLALMKLEKESQEYISIEAIKRSANRAADLTSQLLTFGRRRMEKPQPINLNKSIDEVEELLSRTINPNIELLIEKDPELWVIMADPGQMNQVMMNLSVNAIDALSKGGKLTIKTRNFKVNKRFIRSRSYAKTGDYILLTVSDTGSGIAKKLIPHVFEPFFTTKKIGKGTGLGLAMVYSIVKAHNGWIEVESKPRKGTQFSIYLPRIDETVVEETADKTELFPGGVERILLVDDQQEVLEVGSKILKSVGYNVTVAESAAEAIELYQNESKEFDLIVLDLVMPKQSGEEVLAEILKLNSEAKVIMSGGFAETTSKAKLLKLGARSHINKPYRMHKLLGTVRSVLDGSADST